MFFSDEKNQKTFMMAQADRYVPWRDRWENTRNKSLFASFSSEKEDLP
jgi:hypothetical protein